MMDADNGEKLLVFAVLSWNLWLYRNSLLFENHAKLLSMLFPELISFFEAFDKAQTYDDMDFWD